MVHNNVNLHPKKKQKQQWQCHLKQKITYKKKRTNNTRTKAVCCFTPLSCLIHNSLVQAERPFLDAVQPPPPFQCFYQTRMQSHQRVKLPIRRLAAACDGLSDDTTPTHTHTQLNCFRRFSQVLLQHGLWPWALTEVLIACLEAIYHPQAPPHHSSKRY